jgi:flagellar basal-body rod modification protein FlgD
MALSGISTDFLLQPGSRPTDEGAKKDMDREAFLKLLVAQLKNQDPLEPMEDVEFVSQLTQFSNLEQVMKTNTKLDELSMATGAQVSAQAINMVGRTVIVPGDRMTLPAEGSVEMKLDVPSTIVGGEVEILNDQGLVVRRISLSASSPGIGTAVWDGRDESGERLAEGSYRVRATGVSPVGAEVELSVLAPARVDAVIWEDGVPFLRIGGDILPLAAVREVWR